MSPRRQLYLTLCSLARPRGLHVREPVGNSVTVTGPLSDMNIFLRLIRSSSLAQRHVGTYPDGPGLVRALFRTPSARRPVVPDACRSALRVLRRD